VGSNKEMMGCECKAAPKGVGTAGTYEKSRQGGRNIGRVKNETSRSLVSRRLQSHPPLRMHFTF